MVNSPFLGLKMTDESPTSTDNQTYFQLWRRLMGGNIPESNMNLIDAAMQKLNAQVEMLKAMAAGGTDYYVKTTSDDPFALQVVPDNIASTETQVHIDDVGIDGIEIGDYVRLVTISPDGTAELLDIRNAASGMVHSCAGDAVRAIETSVESLKEGVTLGGNRKKQVISSYEDGTVTLQPGVKYVLQNIPADLLIVLDDTLATEEISQEFNFVILPQSGAYSITTDYFSGLEIMWPANLTFDHRCFYDVRIADGIAVVSGEYAALSSRIEAIENAMAGTAIALNP